MARSHQIVDGWAHTLLVDLCVFCINWIGSGGAFHAIRC